MITPLFSVSQTADALQLRIRAPHSRPRDIQLAADAHDFRFYTSPYLLHLRFEHPVELPAVQPVAYDLETGVATVTLRKAPPHPHFARLHMLSTLLVARQPERAPPSIEVLSTSAAAADASEPAARAQETTTAAGLHVALRELSLGRPRYGFALRYEAVFAARAEDVSQIVELPAPDSTPVWRRGSLRRAAEDAKFCPDHYLADLLGVDDYAHVMEYKAAPPDISKPLQDHLVDAALKLPRREYLKDANAGAVADLAGVLFASAYDIRFTLGERNVESAWTVSRISASMAFLEGFRSVREAVLAAYRRSLAYPLHRNAGLADRVLADVKEIVNVKDVDVLRTRLFRILLELRDVFEDDKLLRLHCDLFLIDYCVWIQTVDDEVLVDFREEVLAITIGHDEIGWDIPGLEIKAVRVANGEDVEEDEQESSLPKAKVDDSATQNASQTCFEEKTVKPEITISALSPLPSPALRMDVIGTRKLSVEQDEGSHCSDDDFTSDSESSCSESSDCESSDSSD